MKKLFIIFTLLLGINLANADSYDYDKPYIPSYLDMYNIEYHFSKQDIDKDFIFIGTFFGVIVTLGVVFYEFKADNHWVITHKGLVYRF